MKRASRASACSRPSANCMPLVSRSRQARRGDLVIWLDPDEGPWNGHAGFMLDGDRVLHAVGRLGGVVIEPFAEADTP